MPMQETFFAFRFAMLRDKFGTSWMIINERTPTQSAWPIFAMLFSSDNGSFQFDPTRKEYQSPCKKSRHIYGLTQKPKRQRSSTHPFSRIQRLRARQRFTTLLQARWTSLPFSCWGRNSGSSAQVHFSSSLRQYRFSLPATRRMKSTHCGMNSRKGVQCSWSSGNTHLVRDMDGHRTDTGFR